MSSVSRQSAHRATVSKRWSTAQPLRGRSVTHQVQGVLKTVSRCRAWRQGGRAHHHAGAHRQKQKAPEQCPHHSAEAAGALGDEVREAEAVDSPRPPHDAAGDEERQR